MEKGTGLLPKPEEKGILGQGRVQQISHLMEALHISKIDSRKLPCDECKGLFMELQQDLEERKKAQVSSPIFLVLFR